MRVGDPRLQRANASAGFHAFSANAGVASCQSCHGGTDNQTGAPPKAIWGYAGDPTRGGGTADPIRAGAHTSHVGATHGLAQAIGCELCHVKPSDALSAGRLLQLSLTTSPR